MHQKKTTHKCPRKALRCPQNDANTTRTCQTNYVKTVLGPLQEHNKMCTIKWKESTETRTKTSKQIKSSAALRAASILPVSKRHHTMRETTETGITKIHVKQQGHTSKETNTQMAKKNTTITFKTMPKRH